VCNNDLLYINLNIDCLIKKKIIKKKKKIQRDGRAPPPEVARGHFQESEVVAQPPPNLRGGLRATPGHLWGWRAATPRILGWPRGYPRPSMGVVRCHPQDARPPLLPGASLVAKGWLSNRQPSLCFF
jgi:hypothetical protein